MKILAAEMRFKLLQTENKKPPKRKGAPEEGDPEEPEEGATVPKGKAKAKAKAKANAEKKAK